jgi:citrate synthase
MTEEKSLEEWFKPGLEGIPVCRSNVGFIDGIKGILEYRGMRIEELAEKSTFEETSYLLLKGKLPNADELNEFIWEVRKHRRLRFPMMDMIKNLPEDGHPMDVLQTVVAGLGIFHLEDSVNDPKERFNAVCRIIAKIPTIIATYYRLRLRKKPILPNDNLSHAANFLYMLTGTVPTEKEARFFDICLILHAEHTLNASTFSARVTGSTLADPYSVISAAIGTLTGPLHGGANEAVISMLHQIGSVERVRPWMDERINKKEKIMGLGHRVYKTKDPRALILQKLAQELFRKSEDDIELKIAEEVEKVALEKLASKGIYPNVDFYSGIVYKKLGLPEDIYTSLFAASRASGWLAHWLEQLEGNRIFRPTQIYTGGHEQPYVPINKR